MIIFDEIKYFIKIFRFFFKDLVLVGKYIRVGK